MIILKENIYVKDNVFGRYTKKTFRCSLCNHDLIFFDLSPRICHYCNTAQTNMRGILDNGQYRINYHLGANER